MKFAGPVRIFEIGESPPVRGAWIEIVELSGGGGSYRSPPVRGAWIEIKGPAAVLRGAESRPP